MKIIDNNNDRTRRTQKTENILKFFRITMKLPLDLQMVLCNRWGGDANDIIKKEIVDKGIQNFGERFHNN